MDGLSLYFVRETDRRRFCHCGMADQRRFNFCCPKPVTADFNDIVHAADDPVVTVLVALGGVAGGVFARVLGSVLGHVTIRVSVDGPQHGGPRILQYEISFRVVRDGVA